MRRKCSVGVDNGEKTMMSVDVDNYEETMSVCVDNDDKEM